MGGLGERLPLGLDRVGRRATGHGQLGPGLAAAGARGGGKGSDRGRQRPTEGGTLATEGRSGQGLGGPSCTDRARPVPTAGDPHRQSRGKGRQEGEGIERAVLPTRNGAAAQAPGVGRPEILAYAGSPAGRLPAGRRSSTSCGAVSPYCVVRA